MSTLLGCIADDFTGATDLAGLLARSGARVSLRIGIPTEPPKDTAPFKVIALKSRTAPVSDAVNDALAAAKWLKAAGAGQLFWKYCSTFDSTPKGNIGPVAEALLDFLGEDQTVYCPAFPENGRSVFMGNLFVGQQPLAESPMKDHPLTPMTDSNLLRLLEPQVTRAVGLIDRLTIAKGVAAVQAELDVLHNKGKAHIVTDAVANEDLETIARACRHLGLLTGGSALAMPLPHLYRASNLLNDAAMVPKTPMTEARTVVLSGSCSKMTNAQVAHYQKNGSPSFQLDPLALAEKGSRDAIRWISGQSFDAAPLIYATADPANVKAAQAKLGVEKAGALVEDTLAACAVAAREAGARRFIVAGGETSGAVTKALDVAQLDIGAEIAPGVPWTYCRSGGHSIALTLKSGNFGKESFFTDAQTVLCAA